MDNQIVMSQTSSRGRENELSGFGGWLLFYTIITVLFALVDIVEAVPYMVAVASGVLQTLIVIIFASYIWDLALSLVVLWALYRRRVKGPRTIVVCLGLNLILYGLTLVVLLIWVGPRGGLPLYFIGMVASVLWILYFKKSKRVANTFVR